MNHAFRRLKEIIPELNRERVPASRILEIFRALGIGFYQLNLEGAGCYVSDAGREYVFLRENLRGLLFYETLVYESVHAFCHYPAPFLLNRQNLEAEVLSLVMMMPKRDLPRLNRIKHQLDAESYELLERRNQANSMWKI